MKRGVIMSSRLQQQGNTGVQRYIGHMRVAPTALHPNVVCGVDAVANLVVVVCGIMGGEETR